MHKFKLVSRVWLFAMLGILPSLVNGQTYVTQYVDQGGYPGSLHSEYYSSTTNWDNLLPAGITTNQWSPADTIPFNFVFHGAQVNTFRVSGNGLLTFLQSPGALPPNPANDSTPTIADANMLDSTVAAYWTAFNSNTQSTDRVITKTFGTAPNRQHWIKWYSYAWGANNGSADYLYMAIVLEETTNNIYVVGMYSDIDVRTVPCVVGVKVDASNAYEISNPSFPDLSSSTISNYDNYNFLYSSTNCVAPLFPEDSTSYYTTEITSSLFGSPAGMELQYGTQGFALGSGTTITSTSNVVNLSGLTPGTKYHYYMRSDCGGSYSAWSGPYTFKTLCVAGAAPFAESFDNNTVWDIDESIDSCFYTLPVDGRFTWNADSNNTPTSSTGPDFAANPGGQYMFVESTYGSAGSKAYLQLPAVDASTLTNPSLGFFYHMYGSGIGTLTAEYSTDTGATWTTAWTHSGAIQTSSTDGWLLANVTMPNSSFVIVRFVAERTSSGSGDIAIDEVTIDEAPSCAHPGIVTVEDALSSTTLEVNWSNNVGTYRVEWGIQGFTQGTGTPNTALITNDSTYTITGLFQNTVYDVYVYGDCTASGNGLSFISTPTVGQTLPSVPYLENFDGTWLPDDRWEEAAGQWDDTVNFTSTYSTWSYDDWLNVTSSPNNSARIPVYASSSSTTLDDWLLTPLFDLGSGGNYQLTFRSALTETTGSNTSFMQSDDSLMVVINTDTSVVWSKNDVVFSVNSSNEPTAAGTVYRVNLSSYTGLIRVGFFMKSTVQNTAAYNFYIDDVRLSNIPACQSPSNVNIPAISSSDVSATWNPVQGATQYVVYVTEHDSSIATSTTITDTVSTDSAFISGLDPNREYDFYVTTICGSNLSSITGPVPFVTNCIPVINAPFFENFDALSEGGSDNGRFANCMTSNAFAGYEWIVEESSGTNYATGPAYDHTQYGTAGGNYIYTEANYGNTGDSVYLELQSLDVTTLTTPGLSFAYHMYGQDMGALHVQVSNDAMNWMPLYSISGEQHTDDADPWNEVNLDLSTLGYDTIAIRFIGVKGSGYRGDLAIDDIRVDEFTGCSFPIGFNVTQTATLTADITWSPLANSTVDIAISATGNPNDSAHTTYYSNQTSGSISITMPYAQCSEFFIKSNCTNDSTSWIGGYEICTPCPAFYTAPYTVDFETEEPAFNTLGTLQNCWSFTAGDWETEDASGTNENSSGTGPFYDNTNFGQGGGKYIFMESTSSSTGDSSIVESPMIYTGALSNDPMISFYYHMYGVQTGKLYVGAKDVNGSWNTVDSIIGQQQTAGSDPWILRNSYLQGYGDTIMIRFIAVDGTSYTSDISLDDITVEAAPTCPTPTNLTYSNTTETSVDLSWSTFNSGATYLAEFGPIGFTPGNGTVASVSANPGTLAGLTAGTCYDVYVREVCSVGDSSGWIGPVTFCTPFTCGVVANPVMPNDTVGCENTVVTLTGVNPNMVWENAEGDFIKTGASISTDTLTGDTTLYARAYDEVHSYRFGPTTDISSSGYGNYDNGEMITVLSPVRIDSVLMKTNGPRSGTIRFHRPLPALNNNYTSSQLDSMVVLTQEVEYDLPSVGEYFVPVNVVLNPGQYFVNLSFDTVGTGSLFRSTSGAEYPYVFDNVMSIDSALGSTSIPLNRVYYLFDWNVTAVCTSPLDSTTIELAENAVAAFTENSTSGSATAVDYSVYFDATTSSNAVSYAWDFGDGNTGAGDTITHNYTQNGTYTVQLIVTGVCGDMDTVTTTLNIQGITIDEPAFNGAIEAFPNPTSGILTLHIELNEASEVSVQLNTMNGQILDELTLSQGTEWTEQLDLSGLPSGVYFITIQSASGFHVERIVRQ